MTHGSRPSISLSRAVIAVGIVLILGVGLLIWASAPDDVPASDVVPAAPATTEAAAPSCLAGESCSALREACKLGMAPACAECATQHCGDCHPFEVGASGADTSPSDDIDAADAAIAAIEPMVADLQVGLEERHVIGNAVALVATTLERAASLVDAAEPAEAIGALTDSQGEMLTVRDMIGSGVDTEHITPAEARPILAALETASQHAARAIAGLEQSD